jgi:Tfp pilus assembly protein PilV
LEDARSAFSKSNLRLQTSNLRLRKSAGLSLVELVVFIVIVSAAVAGIIGVIDVTTRSSVDPVIHKQALAIAEAVLEEAQLQPFTYCDPDDPGAAAADMTGGALAVAAVTTGTTTTTTVDVNHTVSGSNRLMLVGISTLTNETVSSVVWDPAGANQSLSLVSGCNRLSANGEMWIYQLVAPATGTNLPLSVTFAATSSAAVGVTTFTGVNQTTPLGTCVVANGDPGPATVTVTSASDELVFDTVASDENLTANASQNVRWDITTPVHGGGSTKAGASSVTMSWTAGSTGWAIGAVSVKPGGGCPNINEAIGPEPSESRYSVTLPFDNVNDYHGFDSNTAVPSGIRNIDSTLIGGLDGYRVTVSVAGQPLGAIGNDAYGNPQSLLITVTVTGPGNTTVTLNGYRTRYAPNALP